MIFPNYVADWCDKKAPAGYEEFRTALAEYRDAVFDYAVVADEVVVDLQHLNCTAGPVDPQEVEFIVEKLPFAGTPAIDRAAVAYNRLKFAHAKVFAGDPQAPAVLADINALNAAIEEFGRSKILLESTQDVWVACNSEQTYDIASAETASAQAIALAATQKSTQLTASIQMAFQATQDACKAVRVVGSFPEKRIKKDGPPATKESGGAALTFPKTLDVGKKPKKLPVNVKSPQSSYGTVSLKRGSKGIVATGGWFDPGSAGLLMTVPGKTKTGKVTLTLALEGGPTVKGTITLK